MVSFDPQRKSTLSAKNILVPRLEVREETRGALLIDEAMHNKTAPTLRVKADRAANHRGIPRKGASTHPTVIDSNISSEDKDTLFGRSGDRQVRQLYNRFKRDQP